MFFIFLCVCGKLLLAGGGQSAIIQSDDLIFLFFEVTLF